MCASRAATRAARRRSRAAALRSSFERPALAPSAGKGEDVACATSAASASSAANRTSLESKEKSSASSSSSSLGSASPRAAASSVASFREMTDEAVPEASPALSLAAPPSPARRGTREDKRLFDASFAEAEKDEL